jgi:Tol biopolymer transport system component/DNA-binding winged helix-turn-helix (wHTH) protein
MPDLTSSRRIARFAAFEVDLFAGEVRRNGLKQRLSGQPFQVLAILLENAGEIVSREILRKRLWADDTFVDFDHSLGVAINTIRGALGDSADSPRFIETLRGRGYRFIAPVGWEERNGAPGTLPPLGESNRTGQPETRHAFLRRWRQAAPWFIAAISLLALIFVAIKYRRSGTTAADAVLSQIPAPASAAFQFGPAYAAAPTLSPDGRRVAFLANGPQGVPLLWVRSLDSDEAKLLDGTEDARTPFWSPDGNYLAFFAYGKLKKVAVSGGPPVDLCGAPNGRGGTWSSDGTILFAPGSESPLFRVPASGGKPSPVTASYEMPWQEGHRWPQFLPDNRHFLFYAASNSPLLIGGTYVGSLDGVKPRLLLRGDTNAIYAPPGYLLFERDGALMAQRFDASRLKLSGKPVLVANSVRVLPTAWRVMVSASQNGILAYAGGTAANGWQLEWFDRSGEAMGTVGSTQFFRSPHLSPDGKTLAVAIGELPAYKLDIWLFDLARGTRRRLTFNESQIFGPLWSSDGRRLAFFSSRNGMYYLNEKLADGTQPAKPLIEGNSLENIPGSWSPDGRYIAFARSDVHGGTRRQIWMLPLFGDKKPVPFLESESNEDEPSFSPDGKWLAYVSDESGRSEVYIVPFSRRSGRWQVSAEGGKSPRWRRDGKELFYLSPANKLMVVKVQNSGAALAIGSAQTLFQTDPPASQWASWAYDVTADGKKFIVVTRAPQSASDSEVTLVVNWPALLKKH